MGKEKPDFLSTMHSNKKVRFLLTHTVYRFRTPLGGLGKRIFIRRQGDRQFGNYFCGIDITQKISQSRVSPENAFNWIFFLNLAPL